jgi:hypothetical protein
MGYITEIVPPGAIPPGPAVTVRTDLGTVSATNTGD